MIREPSLMSQEIKPMDLMEVIKVCFSFSFLLSPFDTLQTSPHTHTHLVLISNTDMIPYVGANESNIVFAGRDASRALAQSSLKEDQCRPDWYDLTDDQKKVLSDWYTFFSKRYNIKGKVEGAENTGE